MSTIPDELGHAGAERVVVWQCCSEVGDPELLAWVEHTLTHVEVRGGMLLGVLGGSVACAFDTMDLEDAVDLCADLCREAPTRQPAIRVRYGIAIGNVQSNPGRGGLALTYGGGALDRAQLLANHAGAGEVAVDDTAHQHSQELFLFRRSMLAGGRRGHVLDMQNLRRSRCREAVQQLGETIITDDAMPSYRRMRDALAQDGPRRVVVQCESRHHALDWASRAANELGAGRYLRVRQQAGGLQPLGGLQAGLRDLWPTTEALREADLPEQALRTAELLLAGEAIERRAAADMLAGLLAPANGRTWLVLDRLHDVDAASLGVIAEVAARQIDSVLLFSVPIGANVPPALTAGGDPVVHVLSPLSAQDSCEMAAALLGAHPTDPIARRVATLGGRTTLGVLEAARTLVSSGDLVRRGDDFVWRTEPRSGGGAIPVDALVSERMAGLDHDAFRLLEALTVTSPGGSIQLAHDVAGRDGLDRGLCDAALAKLVNEGFAGPDGGLGGAETTVRSAMRNNMPPARVAELHRFCAAALQEHHPGGSGYIDAQLAYHRSEGGHEAEAGVALLSAAHATSEAGFHRMAVRLAAVAMQFDPSSETKARAHALARRMSTPSRTTSDTSAETSEQPQAEAPSDHIAERAIRSAVEGIVSGDYDTVERWLDTAVVAGWDARATRRLRAVSLLSRGETQEALHTLQLAHHPDAGPAESAREAVGWTLFHMSTGDVEEAITAALSALAAAGHAQDATGRGAALHLLAACYDTLDRGAEARQLRDAAEAAP